MSGVVGHRLAHPARSFSAPPPLAGRPPTAEGQRQVAAGGPVDGTTWTVTVAWREFADGLELVTGIRPSRGRERGGGGFAAPVPDPRTPLHIATGRTDDLPPWVLVRAVPDVVSVVVYGRSGRRYDLELTRLDVELGVRFGAVVLAVDDLPGVLVARLADGCSLVECGPWGLERFCGPADPAPVEAASRDVHRRALAAAGVEAAGPGDEMAALRALARGPREPRERAAEVLCARLRGPVGGADPATQQVLTGWVRATATRLDLVGAHLVDLDLAGCRLEDCDFSAATFRGTTRFGDATFPGHARFTVATFDGDVDLGHVGIAGHAEFDRTTFGSDVSFVDATVGGPTSLDHALVRGIVDATRARFEGGCDLAGAEVAGHALFPEATFAGPVELGTVRVAGQVVMDGARAIEDGPQHWPAGWTLADAADSDGYRRLC